MRRVPTQAAFPGSPGGGFCLRLALRRNNFPDNTGRKQAGFVLQRGKLRSWARTLRPGRIAHQQFDRSAEAVIDAQFVSFDFPSKLSCARASRPLGHGVLSDIGDPGRIFDRGEPRPGDHCEILRQVAIRQNREVHHKSRLRAGFVHSICRLFGDGTGPRVDRCHHPEPPRLRG